jgi:hypothetical protein
MLYTDLYPTLVKKVCCLFYRLYLLIKGFGVYTKGYVSAKAASVIFLTSFLCLTCYNKQGNKKPEIIINKCLTWNTHVLLAYSEVV